MNKLNSSPYDAPVFRGTIDGDSYTAFELVNDYFLRVNFSSIKYSNDFGARPPMWKKLYDNYIVYYTHKSNKYASSRLIRAFKMESWSERLRALYVEEELIAEWNYKQIYGDDELVREINRYNN